MSCVCNREPVRLTSSGWPFTESLSPPVWVIILSQTMGRFTTSCPAARLSSPSHLCPGLHGHCHRWGEGMQVQSRRERCRGPFHSCVAWRFASCKGAKLSQSFCTTETVCSPKPTTTANHTNQHSKRGTLMLQQLPLLLYWPCPSPTLFLLHADTDAENVSWHPL